MVVASSHERVGLLSHHNKDFHSGCADSEHEQAIRRRDVAERCERRVALERFGEDPSALVADIVVTEAAHAFAGWGKRERERERERKKSKRAISMSDKKGQNKEGKHT